MYPVLFPSGRILTFSVLALAETYVLAYNGVLLNNPTKLRVFTLNSESAIINA
jgi:hypothetical protein